jgi:peptidyl-prolyl cis-trans isomerase SurA
MILRNKLIILTFALCICLSSNSPAGEVLDGIAATVDDRIILISEVQSQLQLLAMESNIDLDNKALVDSLSHEILKQMIDDKLILIEAEKDTSIKVTSREIEDALNDHIERIKKQFPSEQLFLAQLKSEGLTLKELRNRYKDEVKNQLYKERFLNKRLSSITVSSGEVRQFYNDYVDSLPQRPAGIQIAHILITASPGQAARDSLLAFAGMILDKARSGEDFSLLAKTYSNDGSAPNGGDLGWFGHGDMVAAFEKAAFELSPGGISDIVETQYGYHIIKCTEKQGDRIRVSHILFKFEPTEADIQKSKMICDSLYVALINGADFSQLAAEYSDDENSAAEGGNIGWYAADELSDEFKAALTGLEIGQISKPVLSQFGYHILKVLDKKDARPLDFKEDYNDIEAIAKRYKTQKELEKWLADTRDKYFIEMKM